MNGGAELAANYDDRRYVSRYICETGWEGTRSRLGKSRSFSLSYSTIDANFVGQDLLY